MAGMDDPSELQAGGVHLGGTKYMFIQSDDRLVAGKKVRFRRHRRETERVVFCSRDDHRENRPATRKRNASSPLKLD